MLHAILQRSFEQVVIYEGMSEVVIQQMISELGWSVAFVDEVTFEDKRREIKDRENR